MSFWEVFLFLSSFLQHIVKISFINVVSTLYTDRHNDGTSYNSFALCAFLLMLPCCYAAENDVVVVVYVDEVVRFGLFAEVIFFMRFCVSPAGRSVGPLVLLQLSVPETFSADVVACIKPIHLDLAAK